jgi:hypothetical protein
MPQLNTGTCRVEKAPNLQWITHYTGAYHQIQMHTYVVYTLQSILMPKYPRKAPQ